MAKFFERKKGYTPFFSHLLTSTPLFFKNHEKFQIYKQAEINNPYIPII
jgi:hypothetical protein